MASPMEVLKPLKSAIDLEDEQAEGRAPKKKKVTPLPEKEGGFTGGKPWPIKSKEGVK